MTISSRTLHGPHALNTIYLVPMQLERASHIHHEHYLWDNAPSPCFEHYFVVAYLERASYIYHEHFLQDKPLSHVLITILCLSTQRAWLALGLVRDLYLLVLVSSIISQVNIVQPVYLNGQMVVPNPILSTLVMQYKTTKFTRALFDTTSPYERGTRCQTACTMVMREGQDARPICMHARGCVACVRT